MANEWELISIQSFHASCFELPKSDFFVPCIPVKLLVGDHQEALNLVKHGIPFLTLKDSFNKLFRPLIHEKVISFEYLELLKVDIVHVLCQQLRNLILHLLRFLFNLPLDLVKNALIVG